MVTTDKKISDQIILYSIIISHHTYIFLFIISLPVMILNAPWYISVPLFSWFLNAAIGQGWICPWTALENKYRKKGFGKAILIHFLKHYYIKPFIKIQGKNK
ncbi:MAG: hypothetical protein CM15mP129_11410 [Chloroflexota bacterium]|nr:MAG: hypothetical protein CM15mP129_11410 [Chloroflexota bacterium]